MIPRAAHPQSAQQGPARRGRMCQSGSHAGLTISSIFISKVKAQVPCICQAHTAAEACMQSTRARPGAQQTRRTLPRDELREKNCLFACGNSILSDKKENQGIHMLHMSIAKFSSRLHPNPYLVIQFIPNNNGWISVALLISYRYPVPSKLRNTLPQNREIASKAAKDIIS